jgi:hypothetical protein
VNQFNVLALILNVYGRDVKHKVDSLNTCNLIIFLNIGHVGQKKKQEKIKFSGK